LGSPANQRPPTLLELLHNPPRKLLEQPARKARKFRLPLSLLGQAQIVPAVVERPAPEPARLLEVLRELLVVGVDGVVPDEDPEGEEGGRVEVLPLAVRPPAVPVFLLSWCSIEGERGK